MTTRGISELVNAVDVTLAADVATPDATITVSDGSVLPDERFYLVIDPFNNSEREYIWVSSRTGNVLTVERNLEGSESTVHTTGDLVRVTYTKQNLEDLWDDITFKENFPTGLFTGGEISTLGTVATVAAGTGILSDTFTIQSTRPEFEPLSWSQQQIDFGSVTTRSFSYLYIDDTGTLQWEAPPDQFPPGTNRERVYVGYVVHDFADTGDLLGGIRFHITPGEMGYLLIDWMIAGQTLPLLLNGTGNLVPNTDLTFGVTAQEWFTPGLNSETSDQNPNFKSYAGTDPANFFYILGDGTITTPGTAQTDIDPANYNPGGGGTVSAVGGSGQRTTIQRVYASLGGTLIAMYGQQVYPNLDSASEEILEDNGEHITPSILNNARLIAYILIERNATDLQDGTDVIILDPEGTPIGGGGAIADLDTVYLRLNAANDPMQANLDMGGFALQSVGSDLLLEAVGGAAALIVPKIGTQFEGFGAGAGSGSPAPFPVTWDPGELALIHCATAGGQILDTPTGWTREAEVFSQPSGLSDTVRTTVFSRVLQAGDVSPNLTGTASNRWLLARCTTWPGGSAIEVVATGFNATNDFVITTSPSVTTLQDGRTIVHMTAAGDAAVFSAYANANLTSLTEAYQFSTAFGDDGAYALVYGLLPGTGASGSLTGSVDQSEEEANVTLAIIAAPPNVIARSSTQISLDAPVTDVQAGRLTNIDDPASGNDIGDRDYNDARYLQPGGAGLVIDGGTLTDKTTFSAVDTWEDWDTAITITDPGVAVAISAQATGSIEDTSGNGGGEGRMRVGISIDGGSTYTFGNEPIADVDDLSADIGFASLGAVHFRSGTPTGDILVKVQAMIIGGVIGDIDFTDGGLTIQTVPT